MSEVHAGGTSCYNWGQRNNTVTSQVEEGSHLDWSGVKLFMVEKSWSTKEGASWHKGVIYDAIIGEWIRAGESPGRFFKRELNV